MVPPPRADGMDLDGRHGEMIAVDFERIARRHLARAHQGDVAGCAADLHRDQVVVAQRIGRERHCAHTGGGAGQDEIDGPVGDLVDGDDAAIALAHQERAGQAEALQFLGQIAQIGDDARRDIGIHDGCGTALVFADRRRDGAGAADPFAGPAFRQRPRRFILVTAIGIGIEQADCHRLDTLAGEDLAGGDGIGDRDRRDFRPFTVEAPAHGQAEITRHQNRREGFAVIPGIVTNAAPDFQAVAKAVGGEEADLRALAFEHGIGGDRGTVHEEPALCEETLDRHGQVCCRLAHRIEHALAGIGRDGRCLHDHQRALRIDHDQIGESAADIDADAPGRDHPRRLPGLACIVHWLRHFAPPCMDRIQKIPGVGCRSLPIIP